MRRVLAASLFLMLSTAVGSCASLRDVGTVHYPQHTMQKLCCDCGIAALAMAADTTYERVDRARAQLGIEKNVGLMQPQVLSIARQLGLQLTVEREPLPGDRGIIVLRAESGVVHAAYYVRGLLYDPSSFGPEAYVSVLPRWEKVLYFLKERG